MNGGGLQGKAKGVWPHRRDARVTGTSPRYPGPTLPLGSDVLPALKKDSQTPSEVITATCPRLSRHLTCAPVGWACEVHSIVTHHTQAETEGQRGSDTCPRPHSLGRALICLPAESLLSASWALALGQQAGQAGE